MQYTASAPFPVQWKEGMDREGSRFPVWSKDRPLSLVDRKGSRFLSPVNRKGSRVPVRWKEGFLSLIDGKVPGPLYGGKKGFSVQ